VELIECPIGIDAKAINNTCRPKTGGDSPHAIESRTLDAPEQVSAQLSALKPLPKAGARAVQSNGGEVGPDAGSLAVAITSKVKFHLHICAIMEPHETSSLLQFIRKSTILLCT